MTASLGSLNAVLGFAYILIGFMTLSDLKKGWKTMGFSHFGAAWVALAFSCGSHHLIHAMHLLAEGRSGGGLELVAVLVGVPPGLVFLALRIEAMLGGRGDRFIYGTPAWMQALAPAGAIYLTALGGAALSLALVGVPNKVTPNVVLVGLYLWIFYFILRTQLRNRSMMNGWSLSGVALAVIFPTCTLMHALYATYASTGLYADVDWHGLVVDWISIPATLYFLWVVRALYRGTLRDWNRRVYDAAPDPQLVVVANLDPRSTVGPERFA